ncbi:hypothetical protein B9479_003868 [Cryptococcus floricola]|uniref:Uncharacterized protein n=1 Tax=Cryptococcus floricola TaxID=2591691 RepID=A0A5D3AXI1_9TREE|nr:hypothetical protein B9479_003868 [Cryptococcus floricola]
MCHESPTSQFIGTLVTTVGTFYFFYHIWAYDKGKCLKFTKRTAFRWLIVWMFILSMLLFEAWGIILTYVKYQEWYMVYEGDIIPVPFSAWSDSRQFLVRSAYQLLAIAWLLVLAIHSEETLYWAYLIGAIRGRNTKSWYRSVHFKVWIACCIFVAGVVPGVANLETKNLTTMEDNIFLVGSISAFILFIGSIWLLFVFPKFIQESRRQGATLDVIARLQYFKELNSVRTLFRLLYCVSILTLAIDGRTEKKVVNSNHFWLDCFYISGLFFVFTSNSLSLMILLPRNMADEAGFTQGQQVFVRQNVRQRELRSRGRGQERELELPSTSTIDRKFSPYTPPPTDDIESDAIHLTQLPSPRVPPHRGSQPWQALGEALNIEQQDPEMGYNDRVGETSKASVSVSDFDKPFAMNRGERLLRDGENIEQPTLLNHFRSPADFTDPPMPHGLNIVVVTDTVEVEEKGP